MDKRPLLYVALSAVLFGISTPIAKLLVTDMSPVALAGLLYLGAFFGLSLYKIVGRFASADRMSRPAPLERKDLPWLSGAILAGGVLAPIALMTGLTTVSGFSASLLLNLEGLATAFIAVVLFKEFAGRRLWMALALMTLAGSFLAWDPGQGEMDLAGPLLIILAMIGWGFDNNLTQRISGKDPAQIARIKGLIAGTTSLSLAVLMGAQIPLGASILYAILLGSLSYGLSLVLFIRALEGLGSSRAGAFFSLGPFAGAAISIVLLGETLTWPMILATILMAMGVWLILTEQHSHSHSHQWLSHTHTHEQDIHHSHHHPNGQKGSHSHEHEHEPMSHDHEHWPDQHHRHDH